MIDSLLTIADCELKFLEYPVALVQSDADWEGLYMGNELALQGHRLDVCECLEEVIKRTNVKAPMAFHHYWIDVDAMENLCELPTSFLKLEEMNVLEEIN